jgi:hypothetical protein
MFTATFMAATIAGAADDMLAGTVVGLPIVVGYWQERGAGPAQHAVGSAIRSFLNWGAHNGM